MDWASSIQEQVNPFDFRKEYAVSAFDLKHNFVFSYNYELPFDKLFRVSNRLTQGWTISGVTRYATGLPVTFQSFGDDALVQVQNNGVNSVSIDLPDFNPSLGSLNINRDPRQNPLAFNTRLFSPNVLGTFGNASRRFFYGPGINNYDIALHKLTRITESTSLEFRFETFNTFNHAQFDGGRRRRQSRRCHLRPNPEVPTGPRLASRPKAAVLGATTDVTSGERRRARSERPA
jgi:hypothetical protein